MTKPTALFLSLGIATILIASGCAQPPTDAPSASAPEASSEQQSGIESQTPSSQAPGPAPTPDTGEAPIPDETVELTETASPMGRIEVRVTDAPPREEVTSILVTVAENSVEVHKAVAEQDTGTRANRGRRADSEPRAGAAAGATRGRGMVDA